MVAGILFLIVFFNGWFLILRNGDFSPFLFFITRHKKCRKLTSAAFAYSLDV